MKDNQNPALEQSYQERQAQMLNQWQKINSEGKWFWIFKRGAVWLSLIIFIYGLGAIIAPQLFNFKNEQIYILLGMFGGFMINTLIEWSRMEQKFLKE